MTNFNLSRSVFAGFTVLLVSLFIITGCQQSPKKERFSSAKGINIESFFPADTFMLFKIGTGDQEQLKNLAEMNSYFPNDPLKFIVDEFNNGFEEGAELDEYGISYKEDILTMINERSEFYFAMTPGELEDGGAPDFVIAITLSDEGKLNSLLAFQEIKGKLIQKNYHNRPYFVEVTENTADTSAYFTRVDDVLFVATDEKLLHKGLDNIAIGENLLSQNPVYSRALIDYVDSVLLVYADFEKLVYFLDKSAELNEGENFMEKFGVPGLQTEKVLDIESEVIIAKIEDEGIRVTIDILGKDGTDFLVTAGDMKPSYLMNKIPAITPMIYVEGYNLRQSIDSFLALANSDIEGIDPDFKEGIAQMEQFFVSQNLDLEGDILPFLDKGFAFVYQDNQSLVPGMGLYVDVTGNLDGAVKVSQMINQALTDLWEQALVESPEMEMFVQKEDIVPSKLWKFGLNINALLAGQSGPLQKKLSGQAIEFYYGILEDGVMTFALEPNLENRYGNEDVVSADSGFKKAISYLNGADVGVTYIAPGAVFEYIDRIMQLAREEGMPASDLVDYEVIKSYVMPIKSIVGASSYSDLHIGMQMFVHIAP